TRLGVIGRMVEGVGNLSARRDASERDVSIGLGRTSLASLPVMTSLKAAALELPLRPCPVRNKREERMDLKDLAPNAPIPDSSRRLRVLDGRSLSAPRLSCSASRSS